MNGEAYSQTGLAKGEKKQLKNEKNCQPQCKKQKRPLTVKEQVLEVVREAKKLIGMPSIRAALVKNYKRKDGPAFR